MGWQRNTENSPRTQNVIGANVTSPETASSRWAATEGLPFPLGPTRIEGERAYNFALYSKHAQSVTLLLYTESDIEGFDWQGDHRPRHEADTIVYELHVGGFTRSPDSGVSDEARGTFAGLVEKIPYLKDLGVTVVELMPVFQYDPSDDNYWGYMPLNFFSPHHGYLSDHTVATQHNEVREMIKALHEVGIEVVLDVVYNHTSEGDHTGPVYSYKGIDNSTYYLMADRPGAPYENFSGTGNTLNCANRYVRKMIMDSVRHWACDMRVDGFRFDLASLFTRKADGSVNVDDVPLLSDMASDPALAHLRLIAEPWEELTFQVQEGTTNEWRRVVDTSLESPFDILEPGDESPLQWLHYRVPGRAVVMLVRVKDGG
jgi:pullulanase/glycogen debranching enzyme